MATSSSLVKATRDEIFAFLQDYGNYPTWTADVVSATVLAREGDIAVVEFVSPWLLESKYTLECLHSKPATITYKQVDQYDDRGLRGYWYLQEAPDNSGIIVAGEMVLNLGVWRWWTQRQKTAIVLQRRLDALQQAFGAPLEPLDLFSAQG